MEEGFIVEGIGEVCALFEDAPKAAIPPALLHGLSAGGAVIEEYVAGNTPDKTGDLLADLATTVTLDADFRGGEAAIGFSGDQAHIARWVEFGHREIGHQPKSKDEGEVFPHPFMRQAGEAAGDEAVEACVDAMMKDLATAGIIDE